MRGDGHLERDRDREQRDRRGATLETAAVFSFIGAVPRTDWLPPEIETDAKASC